MKRVGLYFGSFNPVHNGHMEVAQYFFDKSQVELVWFVLSPQNPLKAKDDLLPNETVSYTHLTLPTNREV